MIRGIALAALSSFTLAVKQQDPQMESVFTKDVSEGNAGETMTWWSYPMDDLDKTKELVDSWLGEKAGPFIKQHRNKVYKAALADTEKRMGTLHETCDEGTKCREEVYEQPAGVDPQFLGHDCRQLQGSRCSRNEGNQESG
jgi:hypothetical protein